MEKEINDIARRIAYGHAFDESNPKNHLHEFPEYNGDKNKIQSHIASVLKDKNTVGVYISNNREIYYQESTNTQVAIDRNSKDLGSCYKPLEGKEGFDRELQRELKATEMFGLKPRERSIVKGGYTAINRTHAHRKMKEASPQLTKSNNKKIKGEVSPDRRIQNGKVQNLNKKREGEQKNREKLSHKKPSSNQQAQTSGQLVNEVKPQKTALQKLNDQRAARSKKTNQNTHDKAKDHDR